MSLLSYLSNLFAPNVGGYRAPNIPMPPVAPPKTDKPSCLARGVAKAWVGDRANWKILRPVPSGSGQLVTLSHETLDISIAFAESALGYISALDCRVAGRQMIYEIRGYIYYMYDAKQIVCDYRLLHDTILQHPYPELAAFLVDKQIREDGSNAREAARAAKLEAIEALGCAQEDRT